MNGRRILIVVAAVALLILVLPMTVAGEEETTNITIGVNEYVVLNNDIYIEVRDVGTAGISYAEVWFRSSQDSVGTIKKVYAGDIATIYISGTGLKIEVTLDYVFSNGASFVVTSSKELYVTDRHAGKVETEPVTIPKLTITRTIDPNSAEVGQTVKVTLTIKNTGNGTATDITLAEGTIAKTYKDGCPSTINDIAAGATERIEYDLKIGDDVQPGTREMPASVLNYKGETGVSDSTESQSSVLEIIAREVLLPELTISTDPIDYVVTCGDEVPMVVTITNVGNATSEKVYVKGDLPPGVRLKGGELEPIYESIKPDKSEEYEVTLVANEEGEHVVEMNVMWGADEEATAVFEFRAEKSGLEKYYIYIIAAIPILLILLWIIKRRREYSY
ncbi:MAG: CARDB domain-containing protein [Euryarchaeota archaeon]|nr:CARDB domain-containing protein [Euryarchaeota archaeon]